MKAAEMMQLRANVRIELPTNQFIMAEVNTERCRKKLLGDHYNYNGDVNGPRSGNPLSCNMETLTQLLCFFTSLLLFFKHRTRRIRGY